jgi:hypothetical protein
MIEVPTDLGPLSVDIQGNAQGRKAAPKGRERTTREAIDGTNGVTQLPSQASPLLLGSLSLSGCRTCPPRFKTSLCLSLAASAVLQHLVEEKVLRSIDTQRKDLRRRRELMEQVTDRCAHIRALLPSE